MADAVLRYPWTRLMYPLGSEQTYRDRNGRLSSQPTGHLCHFGRCLRNR